MNVLIETCRNERTALWEKCLEECFRCLQLPTLRSVVVTVLASIFLTLTFRFSTAPWTLVIAFATVTGGFPCWLGCYIINFQSGITVDYDLRWLTFFPDWGLPLWGRPALWGLAFFCGAWSLRPFFALRNASFAWRRSLLYPLVGLTITCPPRPAFPGIFLSFPGLFLLIG